VIAQRTKTSGGGNTLHYLHSNHQALIEAAHSAAHTKKTYLAALYHRIAARRGKHKAIIAVAHAILVILYHLLTRKEAYEDLGVNSFDERERQELERRLVKRLQRLGYDVSLQSRAQAA
jgi:transposase